MDDRYAPKPLARWFWVAAIASFLFMALGVWGHIASVITDPATLPVDQRVLMEARPEWMKAAYAIAVWVGLIGTVFLLMRRRLAVPLLLVSLIFCILTFLPYAVVPKVADLVTTNDIAVAVVVILITGTIWTFARHSRQRGWLR